MTNKKAIQKEDENTENLYTKQQIIKSQRYIQYKDLLMSILKENKKYSSKEIDIKIKKFLERKV